MKKVLLVATVQSHVAQFHKPLMELLKQYDYEIHVVAKDNLGEKKGLKLDIPDKIYNINFDRSPIKVKNIKAYQSLKEIIDRNDYDIIHCNTPVGGILTRIAARNARKNGTKVIYTAHGFHFYKGAPIKNWLIYYPIEKIFSRFTDTIITITKEDYKLAKEKFNTDIQRIHGVGVDPKVFFKYHKNRIEKIKLLKKYNLNQNIILSIGELNRNKNQKVIIKAMKTITKKYPNCKLLIAGNGPKETELKYLVRDLKLEDNVDFLGYRRDMPDYLNIANVVVSMSYREGLPLNVIEAMSCGTPVILSGNRGHNELIKNGKNGIIIKDPDNDQILSDFIIKLFTNKKFETKLTENLIEEIREYHNTNIIKELKLIYKLK